jgi:hypothetical protein
MELNSVCGKRNFLKNGYRDENFVFVLRYTYDAKTAGESLILLSKKDDSR